MAIQPQLPKLFLVQPMLFTSPRHHQIARMRIVKGTGESCSRGFPGTGRINEKWEIGKKSAIHRLFLLGFHGKQWCINGGFEAIRELYCPLSFLFIHWYLKALRISWLYDLYWFMLYMHVHAFLLLKWPGTVRNSGTWGWFHERIIPVTSQWGREAMGDLQGGAP